MPGGPAELAMGRESRVQATRALTLIVIVTQSAALLVVPADRMSAAVAALAATIVWRAVSLVLMTRRPTPWLLWGDVTLLSTLGLLQPWLDVPALVLDDCGWVFLVIEASIVAYPWQFDRRSAMVATGCTSAAYLAGALAMGELSIPTALVSALWLVLTGFVSRWVHQSMQAGARRADEASAAHEQAQREIEVGAALRESELEHLATLHDTVAATLMMVGLGAAGPGIREQAGRDLAVLTAPPGQAGPASQDVVETLSAVIRSSDLAVTFTRDGPGITSPASVADALAGALGEALRNIAKHARVEHAVVELDSSAERIRVRVRDHGLGFTDGATPGRGIRHSITARMARAGGRASVTSSANGVLVELLWPDLACGAEQLR